MPVSVLSSDIRYIKGVGEKRAGLFKRLGVDSVGALLRFYPRAYEDWSSILKISEAAAFGDNRCVAVTVTNSAVTHRIRKGLTIYRAIASDGENAVQITVFNNRFAADKLKSGAKLLIYGKITAALHFYECTSPKIAVPGKGGIMHPIYRLTEGLTSYAVESAVAGALNAARNELENDPLPDGIRQKYKLCTLQYAIQNIHFPKTLADAQIARRRLVFEELLTLRLGMHQLKNRCKSSNGYIISPDHADDFYSRLPFKLTNAQSKAVAEALSDMHSGYPMNRLLQGDVGSGKTAVAAALCCCTAKSGYQSALMAPTEILALQHYKTLSALMSGTGITVDLLTGSLTAAQKRSVRERLKCGETNIIIGTHAVIQQAVEFDRLGLVITDEQHRFGVAQRAALSAKGRDPHVLVMSATPIPRTLALLIYGDLDISVLDELPSGRKPVETYAINSAKRARAIGYIKKHLDEGRQAYIVCPMIDDSMEAAGLAAAQEYYENACKTDFAEYRVGLLHGKLKPAEKERVMTDFSNGDIDLLICTTVIEVGVDVPNAVIMMIENAERFGLSQLHQLRGRIGRGEHSSTCILLSDARGSDAVERLKVMCSTCNGFKIADEDLKRRGPGDFFGNRQHGLPELRIADLNNDVDLVRSAGIAADEIIRTDPKLTLDCHRGLNKSVKELFSSSINITDN